MVALTVIVWAGVQSLNTTRPSTDVLGKGKDSERHAARSGCTREEDRGGGMEGGEVEVREVREGRGLEVCRLPP